MWFDTHHILSTAEFGCSRTRSCLIWVESERKCWDPSGLGGFFWPLGGSTLSWLMTNVLVNNYFSEYRTIFVFTLNLEWLNGVFLSLFICAKHESYGSLVSSEKPQMHIQYRYEIVICFKLHLSLPRSTVLELLVQYFQHILHEWGHEAVTGYGKWPSLFNNAKVKVIFHSRSLYISCLTMLCMHQIYTLYTLYNVTDYNSCKASTTVWKLLCVMNINLQTINLKKILIYKPCRF